MAKEELYHIALDDYEHGIVIRSLNDEKTDLMNEGKSTDAVDDLIIKVGTAPKKIQGYRKGTLRRSEITKDSLRLFFLSSVLFRLCGWHFS